MRSFAICAREARRQMRRYAMVWRDQRALNRKSRFAREALKMAIESRFRAAVYDVMAQEGEV